MPVIYSLEDDMTRLGRLSDFLVNPTHLFSDMNIGLSKAIKDITHTDMHDDFINSCRDGKLSLKNRVHVFESGSFSVPSVINLVMKAEPEQPPTIDAIEESVAQLVVYLKENPLLVVSMPILSGSGTSFSYSDILPIMEHKLNKLKNVVRVCMLPRRIYEKPLYLAIIGSRSLSEDNHRQLLEEFVAASLDTWGLTPSDFTAFISGGAVGPDAFGCGVDYNHPSVKDCIAYKYGVKPIIIKPNIDKYGMSAYFVRNYQVGDIATHCVAFIDKSSKTQGTRHTLSYMEKWNDAHPNTLKKIAILDL